MEDRGSHVRKGIVGDWRHHVDPAAEAAFNSRAGDLLAELAYGALQPAAVIA